MRGCRVFQVQMSLFWVFFETVFTYTILFENFLEFVLKLGVLILRVQGFSSKKSLF